MSCRYHGSPRPILLALHDVGVRRRPRAMRSSSCEASYWRVAVGVEDPVLRRGGEAADERRAVAAVAARGGRRAARGPASATSASTAAESSCEPSLTTIISKSSTDRRSAAWTSLDHAGDGRGVVVAGEERRHAGDDRSAGDRPFRHPQPSSANPASAPATTLDLVVGQLGEAGHGHARRRPCLALGASAASEPAVRRLLGERRAGSALRYATPAAARRARARSRSAVRNTARWWTWPRVVGLPASARRRPPVAGGDGAAPDVVVAQTWPARGAATPLPARTSGSSARRSTCTYCPSMPCTRRRRTACVELAVVGDRRAPPSPMPPRFLVG